MAARGGAEDEIPVAREVVRVTRDTIEGSANARMAPQ
jgi:hypothetical protein